ncbi:Hypothetical predicted protein, partial [Paramuricea clavata]
MDERQPILQKNTFDACKENDLLSASLAIKSPLKTAKGIKTVRQTSKKLVIVRINDCHKRKSIHEKAYSDIERYLESSIPGDLPDVVKNIATEQSRKVKEETHTRLNDKLLALEQKGHVNNKQKPPSNFIKNISSRVLDEHEKTVLSYGMKQSLAPKRLPTAKIPASVESAIYRENLSAEAKETVRAKVASTLQTSQKPVSNLTKAEREALSKLRKDDSIVITPADKANIIKKPLYSKLRCSVAQAPKLYDFITKIQAETISATHELVSFDVKSLFTRKDHRDIIWRYNKRVHAKRIRQSADAADLAERLQQSFTKPWPNANPTEIPDVGEIEHLLKNDTSPPLPSIGQIKATLKHLNPRKATGSDEIPPWLLKRYHEELAPVIHNIICSSISQAKYSTLYKHALVTPVPKIFPPNDMDNDFRQISVLPQLAKVLESIQLKLNKGDLKIKDNQHAFTHGRSTVSALASITQNWFNKTENSRDGRMGIHALFIDFCKAFDLVDHGLLLRKLAKMNVSKSFWLWTRSFLEGRSQQVKLQGTLSSIRPCPSGVPQGSVISPTLFNVHVDDLEDCIPNYLDINTHNNMQKVLDAINDWVFGLTIPLNGTPTLTKLQGGQTNAYSTYECRRADLPTNVGLTCYESKLRPVLEYAAPIWGGLPQYLTDELEKQRRDKLSIREYEKIINDETHPWRKYIPDMYNGSFYQQLHGTAMGSPVSVVVAEIVMQRLEERALSSYPNPPPFWFRYVNDTLTSVDKHQKNDFVDHLNKQNPSLQFTMEPEKDGKIAFLDCTITRDGNSLRTSVYRKPTSTSRLLDNSFYHPTSHKSATIATLVKRAHAVCSSSETLEEEMQHLDKVFTINKYSKPFVNN